MAPFQATPKAAAFEVERTFSAGLCPELLGSWWNCGQSPLATTTCGCAGAAMAAPGISVKARTPATPRPRSRTRGRREACEPA